MSCDRFRGRIRDRAIGALPDAALDAHLESCDACRAVLRADMVVAHALDGEIERAVATHLPEGIEARTRRRVAQRIDQRRALWPRILGLSFRIPLLGALAFLVVWTALVVVLTRPNRPEHGTSSIRESTVPALPPPGTKALRAASTEYRGLEGFQPLRTMTIEVREREGSR